MPVCPHCNSEIIIRELPHQGFKNFRICPNCNKAFTVDPLTKRRQQLVLFVLVVSMVLTILLYFDGAYWLPFALISYAIAGILIYWGDKQVYFVPYSGNGESVN